MEYVLRSKGLTKNWDQKLEMTVDGGDGWCSLVYFLFCASKEAAGGQDEYTQQIHTQQENVNSAGGGRYHPHLPDNQVPAVVPPRRDREYNWKLTGTTECSASCGKG